MKRREFFRNCGLITAAATLSSVDTKAAGKAVDAMGPDGVKGELNDLTLPIRSLKPQTDRQISIVIIGAGSRGSTYGGFALRYPESVKIVGVSDINDYRRKRMADLHDIPAENRMGDFHEVLNRPKFADAVVISTPDDLHYEPCMKCLELGYDVLLEKPCAQTEKECRDILAQAKKYNRIVAVCHVLRYSPYFIALREVVRGGAIGRLVNIQHFEPIQYAHMAHSYVRGNWRNSDKTTPIILAKSCHDLDIMRWIVDRPCETIAADGSLTLFKAENAPEGAPMRCTDGCPHEDSCPYSAIDIYVRKRRHMHVFDLPKGYTDEMVMEKLRTGWYGRCVYHCDNNQPDHYVTEMTFADGKTASFSMDAFTPWGGRRTRIMGTKGYIEGDMTKFTLWDFRTGKSQVWNKKITDIPEYKGAGHGGGDLALMRDFVEAVAWQDPGKLTSTIDVSIESHVMGFAAEKSRKSLKKVKIKL